MGGMRGRRRSNYDSVTGTSSSIQGGVVKPLTNKSKEDEDSEYASAQEDLPSRRDSPSQHLSKANSEIGKLCNSLCTGR